MVFARKRKHVAAAPIEQPALPGMEASQPTPPVGDHISGVQFDRVLPAPGPRANRVGPGAGQMLWSQDLKHELVADQHGFVAEQGNEDYFKEQGLADRKRGFVPENGYDLLGATAQNDRKVRRGWAAVPVTHVSTDAILHTVQTAHRTEAGRSGGREWSSQDVDAQYGEERGQSLPGRSTINNLVADLSTGGAIHEPAWIVKQNDRHFVLNGHHRIVAAREAGLPSFPARILDLDKDPDAFLNITRSRGFSDDEARGMARVNLRPREGAYGKPTTGMSSWEMGDDLGWRRGSK